MDNNQKDTSSRKKSVNNKIEPKTKVSKTTSKKTTSKKTTTSKKIVKDNTTVSSSKKNIKLEDTTEINKKVIKPRKTSKKILAIEDEVTNNNIDKENNQVPVKKSNKTNPTKIEKKDIIINTNLEDTIVPKKLTKKEINRKKYEKVQQRYRTNLKTKTPNKEEKQQIIETEDIPKKKVIEKKENIKKEKKEQNIIVRKIKDIIRKYKIGLSNENNFYLQTENKKKRFTRYVKEASIYTIIITIVNILIIFISKELDMINLFDINALNVVLTMFVILIASFIVSLLFDFFITEIWIKIRRKRIAKKKESEQRGD